MPGIRILSYNIHGGYDMRRKRDLSRLHNFMEENNIDIGVFQEIETRPSRGGTLQDIDRIAGPSRPYRLPGLALKEGEGWYGNLIVSRYPILRANVHDLETKPSWEPRNAVDALIETPGGPLRIIGTHLSLAPWERWSEVRKLVELVDKVEKREIHPLLIMGDINEWRAASLSRLLRHLNETMTPVPCGRTFPSICPVLKLDRVWGSNLKAMPRAHVIQTEETKRLSDHLPIMIEMV
jgi:endonuclease/exonuclease/phosphatase family metal-dependent hydrolase